MTPTECPFSPGHCYCDDEGSHEHGSGTGDRESAWREGWSTGYNAGLRDGRSEGTYWCDVETDWQESETRNRIAYPTPDRSGEADETRSGLAEGESGLPEGSSKPCP